MAQPNVTDAELQAAVFAYREAALTRAGGHCRSDDPYEVRRPDGNFGNAGRYQSRRPGWVRADRKAVPSVCHADAEAELAALRSA